MNMMVKKWKRGLAFVVAVVLTLGLLPASAFAANEPEAQVVVGENTIEGSLYEVVEAVNGAKFATYTIELLQDVNGIGASVTLRNNIVLDLKGHTLTADGSHGLTVTGTGQQVTIQNGTLAGAASRLVYMENGVLTLKNLTSAAGATFSLYLKGGSATISGCNLTSDHISAPLLRIEGSDVTVNGGSQLCAAENGNGVVYVNRGSLTVEDASLTGEVGPGIRIKQGSLTLNTDALVETGNSYGSAVVAEGGTLIVNGDAKILSESMAIDRYEGAQILLNGGIFKYPHSIYEGADFSDSDFTSVAGGYRYNGKSCSHSWGAWNVTKAATCAETGIQTRTCTLCKASEDEVIPATGNHTWGDWTVTKAATCTEAGSQSHTCSVCGDTAEEEIPVIAHQFVTDWSIDETSHWHACAVCGAEGDKAAHEADNGTVTVEPTENTEGVKVFHCTECHKELRTEPIAPLGHQHQISGAWTSDESGHWHACSGCAEQIEKAAHSFGDWTVTTAPTCTEVGSRKHTCSECGYTAEEEIPVTAHQFVTEWSHDETSHWHACANCDAKKDEAAHTENGGVVTTPATATTPGIRTYSCTVCGRELRTETIPATGGSTGGGSTGGGSTGGGSTGGGSTGGGSTGGGSTGGSGEENLPETNTPQTGEPETGDPKNEENLGENDTPLVEKPFLFTDVGENRWFYPAVKYVFDRNLMGGIDTVTFSPNLDTSRGMLVTVLYRLDGAQERGETPDDPMEFGDVPAGKWFTDPVLWASDKGVVNGYGTGNFGPNDNVTREQVAAIFYRYAQYKGCDVSLRGDLSGYTDSDKVAGYARDAMSWAVGTGIIGGMDTVTLAPKGNATRAQIATMLMRFDQFLAENQKDESTNQTVG